MRKNKNFEKIRHRIPYGILSIDYYDFSTIISKADDFENIINKKTKQMKRQGIKIKICPEYFENLIEEYIFKLLRILEIEHLNSKNYLRSLFRKRASDKVELEKFLEDINEEISMTTIEYINIKKIYEEFNPLDKLINSKRINEDIVENKEDEE